MLIFVFCFFFKIKFHQKCGLETLETTVSDCLRKAIFYCVSCEFPRANFLCQKLQKKTCLQMSCHFLPHYSYHNEEILCGSEARMERNLWKLQKWSLLEGGVYKISCVSSCMVDVSYIFHFHLRGDQIWSNKIF